MLVPAVSSLAVDALRLNGLAALGTCTARLPVMRAAGLDAPTLSFLAAATTSAAAAAAAAAGPTSRALHPLLDRASWSLFLPSALVLSLWTATSSAGNDVPALGDDASWVQRFLPMAVAFACGTVGSLVGGRVSFAAATRWFPGYDRSHVALVTASLTASYIGGTVNYFETANVLTGGFGDAGKAALVKLVAGVDVGVMVMYFWLLGVVRDAGLRRRAVVDPFGGGDDAPAMPLPPLPPLHEAARFFSLHHCVAPVVAALAVTGAAAAAQRHVAVPGVAVLLAVLGGTAASRVAEGAAGRSPAVARALGTFRGACRGAAAYMLTLFYAGIGVDARLHELPRAGGAVLAVIGTLLAVHLAVLLALAAAWNAAAARWPPLRALGGVGIDIDTAVVASNACVGGAATAAQMAASFGAKGGTLAVAAGAAGTVGYLVGTPLGLSLAATLR